MVETVVRETLDRWDRYGYTVIHLFGNWYLVRNYSVHARKFSLYGLVRCKDNDTRLED